MKNKAARTLTTLLIAIILGSLGIILPVHATNGAKIFVDPGNNVFPPPYLAVNDPLPYPINVTIANMTGLVALEFKLYWDPDLLECTGMVENLFHTTMPNATEIADNLWKIKHVIDNTAGYVWYGYGFQDLDRALNNNYAPININLTEGYPEGKLAAAILSFKVKKAPTMAEGYLDCNLDLVDVKPGDKNALPIPCTVIDGYYKLEWSPPVIKPYYSVSPPSYEATSIGEEFDITVSINNLHEGWEAVGFEFKLGFNGTILEVLSITEDPWLNDTFGQPPNQGTLFMNYIYSDYVVVGLVVMPDVNGTWHSPFPHTSSPGPLATIRFNATYQGMFPIVVSCDLTLYDEKVGNWLADPIATNPSEHGYYEMRPKVLGRTIDIFTQYPDPYGGQGLHKPSDMFWPQKEVCLYAYVAYNEWPEQSKDVAFQIIDPYAETWGVLYARTNASGIAVTCFRLPWPCDNPEYWLGEWTIIGTVDVACEIVNDTLTFHYDHLIHIVKVTTDSGEYAHCEYMNITIEYKSKKMMPMNVIITVTVKDETGVPFGFVYVETEIGGAEYCHYKNFTEGVSIHVIKWARAGIAQIIVGGLNDWPFNGGTVISAPCTPEEVNILAA